MRGCRTSAFGGWVKLDEAEVAASGEEYAPHLTIKASHAEKYFNLACCKALTAPSRRSVTAFHSS